jgi:ApaG protein
VFEYSETTRSITVTVVPTYLEEQSAPDSGRYLWAYQVTIENQGAETVQLVHRVWKITDGDGRVEEVRGPGVVGEQPVLGPGERFEYTSGTPLSTASGFMVGSYGMRTVEGERFEIAVPAFSLDGPRRPANLH